MARTFTITQEGESREFTIATGVGPTGDDGDDADVTLANVRAAVPNMVEVASPAENDFIQRGPSGWLTKSIEQVKTALGLGTAAYTASTAYASALGADDNYVTDAQKAALHAAATVTGNGIAITGQALSLSIGTGSTQVAAGNHSHALLDSATDAATAGTLVKRGSVGQASFAGDLTATALIAAAGGGGIGAEISSGSGTGTIISTQAGYVGADIFNYGSGTGAYIGSYSGTGAGITSESGTYHAIFGIGGNDRAFVTRLLGALGWWRGAYTLMVSAVDTLTANRVQRFPDKDGTIALTSDISGTNSGTNTGDETAATIATALNAGTAVSTASDTDRIAITSPAGGYMLLSTLWTRIAAILDAGRTWAGAHSFSSTTRPTSSGTGTPAPTSLITLADGDGRYPRLYAFSRASSATTTANNTVATDINGLSLTINDAGTYKLTSFVSVTRANSAMGIKVGHIFSTANGTYSGAARFSNNSAYNSILPYSNAVFNTVVDLRQIVGGVNSQPAQLCHDHILVVTTAPVTVKYQFAQHTSDASNLTADIGNWMMLEKIN